MCACRHKKSFLIDDILDNPKKSYRNLTNNPIETLLYRTKIGDPIEKEKEARFNTVEVDRELELSNANVNLEQRRNTYPLYPMPIKAGIPWTPYRVKANYPLESRHPFSYYSDPVMNSDQILRSQLAVSRFPGHPYIRQTYAFDRELHDELHSKNPFREYSGRMKISADYCKVPLIITALNKSNAEHKL